MASWLHRTTIQHISRKSPRDMEAQFGGSFVDVNGNAQSNADWIFSPDLTAVQAFISKYWIITGDVVSLMSQAERDAVDVVELSTQRDRTVDQLDSIEDAFRGFALSILDEFNILRSQHGLPPRTIAQLKSAMRNKLGS